MLKALVIIGAAFPGLIALRVVGSGLAQPNLDCAAQTQNSDDAERAEGHAMIGKLLRLIGIDPSQGYGPAEVAIGAATHQAELMSHQAEIQSHAAELLSHQAELLSHGVTLDDFGVDIPGAVRKDGSVNGFDNGW